LKQCPPSCRHKKAVSEFQKTLLRCQAFYPGSLETRFKKNTAAFRRADLGMCLTRPTLAEDIKNTSEKSVLDSSNDARTGDKHTILIQYTRIRCLHVRFQLETCLNPSWVDGSRHDHAYVGLIINHHCYLSP